MDKRAAAVALPVSAIIIAMMIQFAGILPEGPRMVLQPSQISGNVTVGALLSLTGDLAGQSNDQLLAVRLAVSDFNEHLLLQEAGWQMELAVEDTRTDPAAALDMVRSLHSDGIRFIVGPQSSAELQNVIEYVNENGMLVISPSSKAPSLAQEDNVFRFSPDDEVASAAIAKLLERRGVEVAIPVYRDDVWGRGLAAATGDAFRSLGGVLDEGIKYPTNLDIFPAEAERLSNIVHRYAEDYERGQIAVLLFGFSEAAGFFNSASHYLNLREVQWVGTEASISDHTIVDNLRRSTFASDVGFTAPVVTVPENPVNARVSDHIEEATGSAPNHYAYTAYDAVWVLGLALQQSGTTDSADVLGALPQAAFEHAGAIGKIRLNQAGDLATSDYGIWRVVEGIWKVDEYYSTSLNRVIPAMYGRGADGAADIPEVVRLGALLSLTGDLAGQSNDQLLAVRLAVSDFNEHLLLQEAGWQMELAVEDTRTDPAAALDMVRSLHSDGIRFIVGPQSSAELQNVIEYVNENGMLVISPSSKAPSLAQEDNVFRFSPDDEVASAAIAKLLERRGVEVAIPVYRDDVWGRGLAAATGDAFRSLGGVLDEGIKYPTNLDIFPAEAERLSNIVHRYAEDYERGQIAVLLFGFSEAAGFFNSASHYLNLREVQWVGTEASISDHTIVDNLRRSTFASDVGFTAPVVTVPENPVNARVSDHIEEATGSAPNHYAYTAYDAVWVLGLSIQYAGSTQADAVREALPATGFSYTGATGHIRLNLAGDLDVSDYEILSLRDGVWERYGYYATYLDEVLVDGQAN